VAKLTLVCVHKRVGDLDHVHVDQSYQVVRDSFLERFNLHHLDDRVEVVVLFAELGQLHVPHIVFENIICLNDVLRFRRHIDPVVNQTSDILIGRVALATASLNFFRIQHLKNKLASLSIRHQCDVLEWQYNEAFR
jgi:hypothetical protein